MYTKNELKVFSKINASRNPDAIRRYTEKFPTDAVRKHAQEKLRRLERSAAFQERAPKCPRCGKPTVTVQYYTAVKGKSVVTGQKSEWTASGQKTTTSYATPLSNVRLRSAPFCTCCHDASARRQLTAGWIMAVLGVLLAAMALLFLSKLLCWLLTGVGILLCIVGIISAVGAQKDRFYANERKDVPITDADAGSESGLADTLSIKYVADHAPNHVPKDSMPHDPAENYALNTFDYQQLYRRH